MNFAKSLTFCLFVTFVFCFENSFATTADSPCGDWVPYKDEKCFKIFDKVGLQSFEDAEKTCHAQDSTAKLITVGFHEEQEFLTKFLFTTNKVVDNVWIGAKYASGKFAWQTGSGLTFTNWASGSPKNASDSCIQLRADVPFVGKWDDEPCKKKNLVVCEKRQTWSLARWQDILMEVKQNPVPIGFIYVQLPSEKAPTDIWPWMTWADVSSTYAGVFFRVTGGDAASFGTVQQDNAPRIDKVDTAYIGEFSEGICSSRNCPLPKDDWSVWEYTGSASGTSRYTRFHTTGGEVRPRNMAMRIWKRTA